MSRPPLALLLARCIDRVGLPGRSSSSPGTVSFVYVAFTLSKRGAPSLTSLAPSQFGLAEKRERAGRKLRKERKSELAIFATFVRTPPLTLSLVAPRRPLEECAHPLPALLRYEADVSPFFLLRDR